MVGKLNLLGRGGARRGIYTSREEIWRIQGRSEETVKVSESDCLYAEDTLPWHYKRA
jgi:hypothetical protein